MLLNTFLKRVVNLFIFYQCMKLVTPNFVFIMLNFYFEAFHGFIKNRTMKYIIRHIKLNLWVST